MISYLDPSTESKLLDSEKAARRGLDAAKARAELGIASFIDIK